MAFTFILLLAPQSFFPVLGSLRIALLTAVVAICAYLFDRLVLRQPIMTVTREMWVTASLVGWAVLTVPLSYWPGGSTAFLLDMYFKTLAVFWLLANVVGTLPRLRRIAWGLSLMAVPLAGFAVKNYLSGAFIDGGAVKRIVGYDAPLTENPNDLALMLNLILPLTVALFLMSPRPAVRFLLLACIVLDVMGVIVTFSRAGFITLATILLMFMWRLLKRPERHWAMAALVVALISVPLFPSGYVDRLSTITDIDADPTGSSQARWNDTVAAVRFILENPIIGAGVGMNILALNEERGALWKAVHNAYLEYATELGIPGFVLFLMLLGGCMRSAIMVQRNSVRKPAFREFFYLAEGIQISLTGFAVAALFHPIAYQFYFYYIGGLAIAAKIAFQAEERSGSPERTGGLAPLNDLRCERPAGAPAAFLTGNGYAATPD
jgi:hypothetical protein